MRILDSIKRLFNKPKPRLELKPTESHEIDPHILAQQMKDKLDAKRANLTIEECVYKEFWFQTRTPKERCHHEKGPMACRWGVDIHGLSSSILNKDYNVSKHTFPDGRSRVRCLWNCGYEVWSDDPIKEKWDKALIMVRHSSNKPSSSEVVWKPEPSRFELQPTTPAPKKKKVVRKKKAVKKTRKKKKS